MGKKIAALDTHCVYHTFCLWPFMFLEIADQSVLEAQGRCGFKQKNALRLSGYEVSKVQEVQGEKEKLEVVKFSSFSR